VDALARRDECAWEILVALHVGDPRRLARRPDPAGQPFAAPEGARVAVRFELRELYRRRVPALGAAQHAARLIDAPILRDLVTQVFADDLQDARRGRADARRLDERARDGVLHGAYALRPLARGDVARDAREVSPPVFEEFAEGDFQLQLAPVAVLTGKLHAAPGEVPLARL
jgi:hypothetical protein